MSTKKFNYLGEHLQYRFFGCKTPFPVDDSGETERSVATTQTRTGSAREAKGRLPHSTAPSSCVSSAHHLSSVIRRARAP